MTTAPYNPVGDTRARFTNGGTATTVGFGVAVGIVGGGNVADGRGDGVAVSITEVKVGGAKVGVLTASSPLGVIVKVSLKSQADSRKHAAIPAKTTNQR
jgi:hypothetical protein